jgi:hypothetical protein
MPSRSRQPERSQDKLSESPRREQWAKGELWEWIAIFLSIAALWPKILRWPGILSDVAVFAAAILMIWVFIRRARRMKESWRK